MTDSDRPPSDADPTLSTTSSAQPPSRPPRSRQIPVVLAAALIVIGAIAAYRGLSLGPSPTTSSSPTAVSLGSPASPGATFEPTSSTTSSPTEPPPSITASASPSLPPPRSPGDYLLLTREELLARPTSGPAWDALVAIADEPRGSADLRDQNERTGVRALAAALVYARTGGNEYRDKAREQVMAAIGTEEFGANNSILSLGRQLGGYVLAADFIGLAGADDARFRAWLDPIRTRQLGGHGRWTNLVGTHEDAPNNWGSFTGASRIAAGLYLGDRADVARAAQILRGYLGDRSAWSGFQPVEGAASWACDPRDYVPLNPPCVRDGINLDGAIVRDIDRGGNRKWPPGADGVSYTLESLQGLILQAELLTENGYGDAWTWSDEALRRAADVVTRSGQAGGKTWNRSQVSYHVPWLLNARYGLDLPTEPAGPGRIFGYTDWLYGE